MAEQTKLEIWKMADVWLYGPFNSISFVSSKWKVIIQDCMQWYSVYDEKNSVSGRFEPCLEVIKNSCSIQLSMKFFLLINVKMHGHFNIYEQEK